MKRTNKYEKNSQDVLFPTINGIIVDCKALSSIKHSCISNNCKISQCCCSQYEVFIDNIELSNIVGALPYASQYSTILKSDKSFANIFGDEGKNTYSIDKNNRGFCVFGYKGKEKSFFCSLHKAAVDMKIPLKKVKPLACILWPLALVESDPVVLTVQEDVTLFPCNQEQASPSIVLDNGIAQIIKIAFGSSFHYKLNEAIKGLNSNSKGIRNANRGIKGDG